MEKRTAPVAKASATAAPAKPAANDDVKKQTNAGTRPAAPKIAAAPRPIISTPRSSDGTINKPPARPIASTRKPTARGSTASTSVASEDGAENKRPARMSTVNAASSRPARPEPSLDKTRRTTLGPSVATVPAKRPIMAPRTNTASPTKLRQVTTPPKQTASSRATKPPPSPTKSFISTNDSIPEEPEQVTGTQTLATLVEHPHASPPKLEIRSMKSSTPALKPQALSDNELGQLPPFRRGHSRTQSAIIPSRPMTAPAPAIHPQEQSLREMEVIQNLLRESTKRDDLTFEIRDLKAEVSRLEARNAKLIEASKTASPVKPPMERTNTADASAKEKALKVMLTSQHTAAMDELKAAHKASISELEKLHSTQLQSIKSELETQRRQSSRLEGVEGKIEAVEDALRESKQRASLNEQEVRVSEQEKDKLARVIADLRTEIGRCQAKLNDDVLVQKREKKELEKVVIELKKELERVRTENAAAFERQRKTMEESADTIAKLRAERSSLRDERNALRDAQTEHGKVVESHGSTLASAEERVKALEDAQVGHQKVVESYASNLADAEERVKALEISKQEYVDMLAGKDAELYEEVEKREGLEKALEYAQAEYRKVVEGNGSTLADAEERIKALEDAQVEYEKVVENNGSALADAEERVKALEEEQAEYEKVVKDRGSTLADAEERVKALEAEQAEYQKVVESNNSALADAEGRVKALVEEQAEFEKVVKNSSSTLADAEERVKALGIVVEVVQNENKDLRQKVDVVIKEKDESAAQHKQMIDSLRVKHADLDVEVKKRESLENALEDAQAEHQKVAENHGSSLADAEERIKALGIVVEVVQNESKDLQQKVDGVVKEKDESAAQLNETIDSLRAETETLRQRAEEQVAAKEKENAELTAVVEELHKDTGALQRDAQNARRAHEDDIEVQKELFERLQNQLDEVSRKMLADRVEKEAATGELAKLKAAHAEEVRASHNTLVKMRQEQSDKIEKLRELVSDAEMERLDAEATLVDIKSELSRLQTVLEIFEGDCAETDGKHASALAKLRQDMESEHASAVEKLRGEMESKHHIAMTGLQDELEASQQKATQHEEDAADLKQTIMHLNSEKDYLDADKDKLSEELEGFKKNAAGEVERLTKKHDALVKELQEDMAPLRTKEDENKNVAPDMPMGLSHVFVNLERGEVQSVETPKVAKDGAIAFGSKDTPGLAETPLAYASDEEHYFPSPTPAYPKGGRRAGARTEAARRDHEEKIQLAKENSRLKEELTKVEGELEALKSAPAVTGQSHGSHSPPPAYHNGEIEDDDDPFAPRMNGTTMQTSPLRENNNNNDTSRAAHSPTHVSLEGTLASLRVQTEQLLEINDDFVAEQKRWNRKLGLPRSSSLRAAS
ncbi:hypothetical protein LTR56_001149 [Elasticomyces elasticus]|nr:hypothetical protein LTR56_001149 [Elasticomyces elasticus]KAK3663549.1 hypothetical protein LTR22_005721 [Elasticomyces elasticus]KAK4927064.1 hypothetical protein LTR49_005979 [Elasticomyces elasticus]